MSSSYRAASSSLAPDRGVSVTDLVAQRADHTTVTIYTHSKPYLEEVSAWAGGKTPDCKND